MKIYTSYFGNHRQLERKNIMMMAVSLSVPTGFKGPRLPELTPTQNILLMKNAPGNYRKYYRMFILDRLNAQEIVEKIQRIGQGRDVALCCYEKPGRFCHRQLIAEWLNKKTGVNIVEFTCDSTTDERKQPQEGSLF